MHIAMLSYHTCPLATLGGKNTGGMNVYVRDLARQLGRMGIHVDVFTRSQDEHVPHVLHDLGYGNRIVHIPAGPEVPLPKKELASYVPEFGEGIKHFANIKKCHYDVIHSHYWMSGLAAQELKKLCRAPVVHMFHTLGHMKNRIAGDGEAEGTYRIEGEMEVLKFADRIVAATPAEFAQLQWLYRADTSKIVVIPPGVELSRFYPIPKDEAREFVGIPPNDYNILFVGRIEPLKGIDILIRAMGMMTKKNLVEENHVCVTIIGGDPDVSREEMSAEMTRLQSMRGEYGMGELVTFLGKRAQDTLPYYYSAADVVVMPSHYESFGMVALEAMACGTPVIAAEVGGLAFLVKDGLTGYHVPGDDPEALCTRLVALITNRELQAKMGAQAADYAKNYSWRKIAPQIVDVYENLISTPETVDEPPAG